ncbi:glycoside hydrolase family 2 TIM barrel-domain containing protein [Parabacteroides sp. PF5-6]|uniref:glycoside hydrolase family 2 TIM barrel-domain containing protein n=1 Tax=Parabacteroides sp. PF5-6 TaxID=1742403 RepID=UPI00240753DE|nr:glycoside hydrolase family 2 TIM barrel-domain containing protein [Parabacteroides sp. PF5-6]MDF9831723.1 beta-galactosidase/beta-glucuronidase [Parabacteroides sp. PF5-6]
MKQITLVLVSLLLGVATLSAVPRAEYPRPQFQRAAWVNLNGEWTCSFDFSGTGLEREFFKSTGFKDKITVPFCPESELSGIGYKDFIEHFWYHRTLDIPQEWDGKNILLNFGAVYYQSEIYIDGVLAGRHFGGTSSFSVDITSLVKAGGSHNLVVYAESDLRSGQQAGGKQNLQFESYACNYTRTTGIWQTVWMEAVHPEGLHSAQVITDIDQQQVIVRPRFYKELGGKLQVTLKDNGKVVAQQTIPANAHATAVLPVKKMKTWSPESPFLYDVEYKVLDKNGKEVDRIDAYLGMRKIHIEGNKIYLNNQPYYQRLVLDQGFYPDGIWTAPSDEALKRDIELSMAAGFNGARLHQKVFEERFYYWADKMGYLTWGEASSWGMDCNDPIVARNFITEWCEIVERDRNHPSLLIWTPTNEEFWPDRTQYPRFMTDLYKLTKMIDPTRPFHGASGGTHIATDIWTVHDYEQDPAKLKEKLYNGGKLAGTPIWTIELAPRNIGFNGLKYTNQYKFPEYKKDMPYLVDEFGGIKWNPAQQLESAQNTSWGYGEPPRSLEEFYKRLEGQVDVVLSLSADIWGYCYTQLTDVEQEQNGIYYYDRSSKFDMERIRAIFSKTPEK